MAGFGAQHPMFAPFAAPETDSAMPTYEKSVVLGNLVAANLTVNLASGEAWGDDKQVENLSEFASAAIPMETLDMLDEVSTVVYGNEIADQAIFDSSTDEAPYGGLSYFKSLMRGGKKYYQGFFYPKAKAALGNDNAQTKGSSVTFQNTTTNFTITSPLYDEADWRRRKTFSTMTEVKAWQKEQFEKKE